MRVLVTGGGGFIGFHLAQHLTDQGQEVVVVDRDPARGARGSELIRADLNAPGVAEAAVRGVDTVFHLAARVGIGRGFADAPGYTVDNDLATARLLAALSNSGFSGRLVLSSSMVVYGEGRYRCPKHGPAQPLRRMDNLRAGSFEPVCGRCERVLLWELVDEDASLRPRSVYAASKVAQEQLCAIWARECRASVVALRYHNVYGPGLPVNTPYAGVAAIFRSALRAGESPQVFEDGGQTRDFVHVDDVVRANMAALALPLPEGACEVFNVCSGRPVTIGEVATALWSSYGSADSRPVVTGRWRSEDVRHVVASPVKAREVLGFSASVNLEDGLRRLAQEEP